MKSLGLKKKLTVAVDHLTRTTRDQRMIVYFKFLFKHTAKQVWYSKLTARLVVAAWRHNAGLATTSLNVDEFATAMALACQTFDLPLADPPENARYVTSVCAQMLKLLDYRPTSKQLNRMYSLASMFSAAREDPLTEDVKILSMCVAAIDGVFPGFARQMHMEAIRQLCKLK